MATTRAAQLELLASPLLDPLTGQLCSGYLVEFYAAGTSTGKNVWTEKEKTNPYTTRTLGSGGNLLLYGDGVYKIIVKNLDGTAVLTLDNQKIQATTFSVVQKIGTYTATPDDDVILCDGTFTVNLQTVANFEHPLTIKNIGSGDVTIDPFSTQTIDDASTYSLGPGSELTIVPDKTSTIWRSQFDIDITDRTELTTPAPADALLIEDVSESGQNEKYITAANLLKLHYLSGYASLAAAITAISTTSTKLVIDTTGSIADDLTIPANVNLVWYKHGCEITVAATKTLTINGDIEASSFKLFTFAAATAGVAIGKPSVTVNAVWFGAVADGATTDNKGFITEAAAATPANGKLWIPAAATYYKCAVADLTEVITITRTMTVQLDGELRGTSSVNQANAAYILNVTGDDVVIQGSGTLRGVGTYVVNEATHSEQPGLLRVTGTRCHVNGIHFVNPPTLAISFEQGLHHKVENCHFTGGPLAAAATDTKHYYILLYGDGGTSDCSGTQIINNHFYADGSAGSTRNAIINWYSSTRNVTVTGNTFKNIHEHCVYFYVSHSIVTNNTSDYSQTASDQKGGALVVSGASNVVNHNTVRSAALGGIQLRGSSYSDCSHNRIYDVGGIGIALQNVDAATTGLNYNKINFNTITGTATGGVAINNGIRLYVTADPGIDEQSIGNEIMGNVITGMGNTSDPHGALWVSGYSTREFIDTKIEGNFLCNNKYNDVITNYVLKSDISRNKVRNNLYSGNYAFELVQTDGIEFESNDIEDDQGSPLMAYGLYAGTGTADIWMLNNLCIGASNANPYSHSAANNILGRGNRLTRESLIGVFTITSAAASVAVSNANVIQATLTDQISWVLISPLTAAAAGIQAGAKHLYMGAAVAKTSFTMWTGDGGAAGADGLFAYELIQ